MTPQRLLFMAGQRKSPEIKGFRAKRKGRQFLSKLPTFYGGAGVLKDEHPAEAPASPSKTALIV